MRLDVWQRIVEENICSRDENSLVVISAKASEPALLYYTLIKVPFFSAASIGRQPSSWSRQGQVGKEKSQNQATLPSDGDGKSTSIPGPAETDVRPVGDHIYRILPSQLPLPPAPTLQKPRRAPVE